MIRSSYFRYYTQPYTRRKRDSERSNSASERARESEKSRGGGSEFPSVRSIEVRRDSDGGGGSLIHSHPERGGTVAFRWGWNPKTWRCCNENSLLKASFICLPASQFTTESLNSLQSPSKKVFLGCVNSWIKQPRKRLFEVLCERTHKWWF